MRYSPFLGEAVVIRESLFWLKILRLDNVILESDCLLVIYALIHLSPDVSKIGILVSNTYNDINQ
ncbi:hypothetical protein ES288_A05G385400v1 [Gossypium darwinii]|uniref:RNase H type-1 domain-containing protein n=1 Tax=Gossypium darwinii TaxID=34276 RepID=A0A5D2GRN8_GOSDA|nr:hypothetical protein ES288_A05G385400v1 [Gossypium darwinii]